MRLGIAVLGVLTVVYAATREDAHAQRRRRGRANNATPVAAAALVADAGAAQPSARGDDPERSALRLNESVNLTVPNGTLTMTGSRAWAVRGAVAFLNETGQLTMVLQSNPLRCPQDVAERARLANQMQIDCVGGGSCRLAIMTVPMRLPLTPTTVNVQSPGSTSDNVRAIGAQLSQVNPNDPAAMQAAVQRLQALSNQQPGMAVLGWKNDDGRTYSEAASGGSVAITAVNGRTLTGTFSLTFAGPPAPRATGTPTLDGRFSLTICS
jgi:hypothetical protein